MSTDTDTDALVPVAWIVTRLLRKDDEGGKRVRYLHLYEGFAQEDFDAWGKVPGSMPQLLALYGADTIERLARERDAWKAELSTVMPASFKEWHEGADAELPNVAAWAIQNLIWRLEEAERERDEAVADAARYRWLRDEADYMRTPEGSPQVCLTDEWGNIVSVQRSAYPQGETLDAAIDAAIRTTGATT